MHNNVHGTATYIMYINWLSDIILSDVKLYSRIQIMSDPNGWEYKLMDLWS